MPKHKTRILLAIDDSKYSENALRTFIAERVPALTAVRVLHAVEPVELPFYPELTAPFPVSFSDIEKKRREEGRKLVDRAVARLRAAGFDADGVVRSGPVRTEVVETARKWRAELIMLGSHGRKGLARIMLGSVSDYVAHHAHCSVQIVRLRRMTK